jgi:hypothetical protein
MEMNDGFLGGVESRISSGRELTAKADVLRWAHCNLL